MYIGNNEQNEMNGDSRYRCKFVFIFPGPPKHVPVPEMVRKENTLTFYLKTFPEKEEFDKLLKWVNSSAINPAPEITARFGGVKYKIYTRDALTQSWVEQNAD